ncbi:dTDP-4-dehydrorhamnose reductase [Candidatus Thiomargarita nelsonii]|uniref:dTDP-4-dehydrorhamnose reductase n=1 Tax=Candidatus Thiomargarita nelsonii TaxID=1003181 RepID=A0A0A6P5F0_9GAMM|nr:dTDP-4-dehydrorhamnose reductase [Candidatus Thiomargarita nelsonii]
MSQKKILLIGTSGQVGWELQRCVQTLGDVVAVDKINSTQRYIDLANPDSIRQVIRDVKPAIILNAAAYTAVDKAEEDAELAHAINATAVGILAEESLRLKSLLIHYSTDYVFNGKQTQPYTETDEVNPLGVYGATKLAGEQAIQAVGGQYFILRTAWVYGLRGKNFLLTMQRLAKERNELKVVADQFGAPTWSRMIAQATTHLLTQLESPLYQLDIEALSGIYHLTCAGKTSWYDFAKAIIAQTQVRVLPLTTAEYPTPTERPAYSVLSNAKLAKTFGITLPAWDRALNLCCMEN